MIGLALEIHWINEVQYKAKFIDLMEKLSKHFILVHVHGNNWGSEFEYEGFKVPRVPEFSFVNKRYVPEYAPDNQDYPIPGIDFPNNTGPDCDLSFLKAI